MTAEVLEGTVTVRSREEQGVAQEAEDLALETVELPEAVPRARLPKSSTARTSGSSLARATSRPWPGFEMLGGF